MIARIRAASATLARLPKPRGGRQPVFRPSSVRRAAAVAERSEVLPVAVQVVGPAWRENIVLAAMFAIEDHARAGEFFPRTPVQPTAGT